MDRTEFESFCKKNKGKPIRIDGMVLKAGDWGLRPDGNKLDFYYPNVNGILEVDKILKAEEEA